jgi:predicted acyltransferase
MTTTGKVKTGERLVSLDMFRGITIAAMILVNFPGKEEYVYAPLNHTHWNGISPTDLIAPFFLFIVGVSIAFSYTKRLEAGIPASDMYPKLIRRAVKIYLVGMFLNVLGLFPDFNFSDIRYTGTLHRIAIVFLVCGIIFLNTGWRVQALIAFIILIGYWLAMTMIPTPGYGRVMLERDVNLAQWVDQHFMPGHLYQGVWDPEGILSTFPSVATGITGMLAGRFLINVKSMEYRIMWLFLAGFISTITGVVWNWTFPLNENIWTSSFVLFTSGLASMTLASCIFLVDLLNYRKSAKFGVIYGMNAIAVYVLADILSLIFYLIKFGGYSLNEHFFRVCTSQGAAPKFTSMIYAIIYVGILFIPAYLLYRKKIFIRL